MIHRDGSMSEGRPLERTPAAQKGHNKGTIAIAMHGGQDAKDDFSTKQIVTLREFCEQIRAAYDGDITFHGHCEVVIRDCPVYDYKAFLCLDKDGHMPPLHLTDEPKPKRNWLPKIKAWGVND
jgi:hypothetical protein